MSKLLALPEFWYSRLAVALGVAGLAVVAAFGEGTLLHRVVAASGPAGTYCTVALALLAGLAMLDVLINDIAPRRFTFDLAKDNRHLVYMGLAVGTFSLAFVIQQHSGLNAMHVLIFIQSGLAVGVAFLDLYARHQR